MSSDIWVAIISGSVTIAVGVITAISAYIGSIKGVKSQIKFDQDLLAEKEKDQFLFINMAIEQFILNEVQYNFSLLNKEFMRLLSIYDNPVQYGHRLRGTFRFEEFNRFKGELIKHESKRVGDLVDFYSLFYRINYTDDLLDLDEKEYLKMKKILKKIEDFN